ncbi:MAG: hypothetical protein DSN69_00110 [Nitrosopumilus sp. YT1]|nr:MAG: hypothetical protein DSN69_00110 [Nitrosopumilus sp. YT1]
MDLKYAVMVDCNGNSNWTYMGWDELYTSIQVASNSRMFFNFITKIFTYNNSDRFKFVVLEYFST